MDNKMEILKMLKVELSYDPAIPTPWHIDGENHNSKRYMHPDTHCSTIYSRTWKQPKCPLTEESIKMWQIYTMEFKSAMRNNKIISFAAPLMGLRLSY